MHAPCTSAPIVTTAELRALFPHTERMVYFDHAAAGPLARPVVAAVQEFLFERGDTNPNNHPERMGLPDHVRARAGELLGAPVDRVDLASNTSYALNMVAMGYPWQRGDRVAVPACEFPANAYPWLQLRRLGVEIDLVPDTRGVVTVEDISRVLTPMTRVVAVSWVQFLSGYRLDLRALAEVVHASGALLVVDATQGLGALELDARAAGVDFLAAGAQKWLLGMQGVAVFYVTEALQEILTPIRGWLNGPVDPEDYSAYPEALYPDARRFRVGTLAVAPVVALDLSLGLLLDAGAPAVERAVVARTSRLAEGLDRAGYRRYGADEVDSGIVTIEHPEAARVHAAMRERGVRIALRNRMLRFSPHAYNTEDEVDRTLDALTSC